MTIGEPVAGMQADRAPAAFRSPGPSATAPRRRREVVCPYFEIDGAPAERLTGDDARPTHTTGPRWLQTADRRCTAAREPVPAIWAYDVCLSSWSRGCPMAPADGSPSAPALVELAKIARDLAATATQLAIVCRLSTPFAPQWRARLLDALAADHRRLIAARKESE